MSEIKISYNIINGVSYDAGTKTFTRKFTIDNIILGTVELSITETITDLKYRLDQGTIEEQVKALDYVVAAKAIKYLTANSEWKDKILNNKNYYLTINNKVFTDKAFILYVAVHNDR